MASPVVAARHESALTTAGTSHTVNLAAGITAGDLLIVMLAFASATTITLPAGWTNHHGSNSSFEHIAWKEADGSEGTTITVTSGTSTKSAHMYRRITGAEDPATQAPEIQVAVGTSTTPDPPSISPTGGSKDYLFIAFLIQAGEEADDDTWCNSGPSGYTFTSGNAGFQKTSGTGGAASSNCSVASADLQSTTATEDPGTFSVDQSLGWVCYTIAVHPAGAATPASLVFEPLRYTSSLYRR